MAFSRGATGLSHLPSCFELILWVTIESVQESQVYLEWIGTSGSFGMVARPLEFLSTFMLRVPPLEMRRERRESFPYETGKGSLISSSEAETGLPWMCSGPSCFLSSGDGCVGTFLSCRKGVKDPLEVPGVRCD